MAEQFAWELRFHPQQVDFFLDGIRHGFKLGFCPPQKLKSANKNKPSATQHASVIDAYLANEVSLGRVAGPFNSPPPPSPTSKLVVLVSFRKRANQANGVSLWICLPPWGLVSMMGLAQMSLLFITSLLIKLFVQSLAWGKGPSWLNLTLSPRTAMFLFTHPTITFLGMKWRNQYYVDLALPFGLRSAPFIFNAIADLVEWILVHSYEIPDLLYYLDDFITMGPP